MDMDHLGLKLLKVLLQALQLIRSFVICSDGLVDHAEGASDEFQSECNEAHYTSRKAEWVHYGSDAFSGASGVQESGVYQQGTTSRAHQSRRQAPEYQLSVLLSLLHW